MTGEIILKPSPLREWLREWSAARRNRRRLVAIYGETIRAGGYQTHVPYGGERYHAWLAKVRAGESPHQRPAARTQKSERYVRLLNKRAVLAKAQDGRCYLCDHEFTEADPPTLEHVTPRHLGGKRARNLLVAHADCNRDKASRPPTERELAYLRLINERIG